MLKPFIDITVSIPIIGSFNALEISGLYVFFILSYLYIKQIRKRVRIFNEKIIFLFLLLSVFPFIIPLIENSKTVISILDFFIKVCDAYLVYFIAYDLLKDNKQRLRVYKVIWLSILMVSVITLFSYFTGQYNVAVTKGVTRVAGLYNDPGSPSYLAVILLIFAILYNKLNNRNLLNKFTFERFLYISTFFITGIILYLTLTKSAILMFLVFLFLWFGIYKKKTVILLPIVILFSYFAYSSITDVQKRVEEELTFLDDPKFETARSLGTGRFGRWARLWNIYNNDFDNFQKFFGSSSPYNAHNQFFAYLMMGGVVLLTIFIYIIFRFYRILLRIYKYTKSLEIYMTIILFSCFISLSITGHPFFWTTMLWYLMLMLGLINIPLNQKSKKHINLSK